MKLSGLLEDFVVINEDQKLLFDRLEIGGVSLDSRQVKAGDLFVALVGSSRHGLQHIDEAIEKGAGAVLFEPAQDGEDLSKNIQQIPAIAAKNVAAFLGDLAARFYGYPSEHLEVIGITGTNGKTTCSQFLGQLLNDCGIIGTLGWGDWGDLRKTMNTTPDAVAVQKILAKFVSDKKKVVAMEVSSHGLAQNRVNGVKFKGAVFTNLSRDHLDYHLTMDEYFAAKLKLMKWPGLEFAVINLDGANSEQIISAVPESVHVWGISAAGKKLQNRQGESLTADKVRHNLQGIEFEVNWRGQKQWLQVPVYGDFNVENILCVLAVMLAQNISLLEAAAKLKVVKSVVGRMEPCVAKAQQGEFQVFIDYAHTPDALSRVLASVRPHCRRLLWVVFGCGGDRDAGKRSLMGEIADQWADHIIVTDDNPRYENNEKIAEEILKGCSSGKAELILDRKRAIEYAIANANVDDCIVIAGKGHEDYQEIKGVRYPLSDKLIAEAALNKRFAV